MRTTVDINDTVLKNAKKRAADENATLREIIEAALRRYLTESAPKKNFRLKWKPHRAGVLLPGVVLEDRDNLFDAMESR